VCVRCRSVFLFHAFSSVNDSWGFIYDILTSQEVLVSSAVYCVMERKCLGEGSLVCLYIAQPSLEG